MNRNTRTLLHMFASIFVVSVFFVFSQTTIFAQGSSACICSDRSGATICTIDQGTSFCQYGFISDSDACQPSTCTKENAVPGSVTDHAWMCTSPCIQPTGNVGQNQCDTVGSDCCVSSNDETYCTGSNLIPGGGLAACKCVTCGTVAGDVCCAGNTCTGDGLEPEVILGGCTCKDARQSIPFNICAQIPESDDVGRAQCCSCITGGSDSSCVGELYAIPPEVKYVWTAIGCISTNPEDIVVAVIRIALSIAGAVVLLTILASAFMLSVSQGDAKKVEDAKNSITAAVSGLLFIIFSMVILRFVGVDVLQIPGF